MDTAFLLVVVAFSAVMGLGQSAVLFGIFAALLAIVGELSAIRSSLATKSINDSADLKNQQ